MSEPPIQIQQVWKSYGLPFKEIKSRLGRKFHLPALKSTSLWALQDITFDVQQGDALGIIGRNGAGKSTLLKILARVTPPTRGRVNIQGRVFPMVELNAGLHMELTGRENVNLLGAIMGLTRRDISVRMPAIKEFCELEDWFERPVRKYSSGMLARLGFAVAMHVDADILLIDEVLSVGDFAFQKKCLTRIGQVASEGTTLVFVSHNPYMIERICNRVLWIDNGQAQILSDSFEVLPKYFESAGAHINQIDTTKAFPAEMRPGSGDLRFVNVEVLDRHGHPARQISTGDSIIFRLHYTTKETIYQPNVSISLLDPQNTIIAAFAATNNRSDTLEGTGFIDCLIASLPLMPNIYTVQVRSSCGILLDLVENAAQFIIKTPSDALVNAANRGLIYVEAKWQYHQD